MDFSQALELVRKELTAGDVHVDTAMGNGGSRKGRLDRLKLSRGGAIRKRLDDAVCYPLNFISPEGGKEYLYTASYSANDGDYAFYIYAKNDADAAAKFDKLLDTGRLDGRVVGICKFSDEHTMTATVAKAAPTGKTVWAWASVIEENGVPVIDHQGDVISEAELEKAFDGFMENSRDVGLMHNSVGHGRVTQGLVFTKELQQALGIDLGRCGALVKINVDDPEVQKRVASGELRELSIGGTGKRKKI